MNLDLLFKPKSIGVLGASSNDNSIGGRPIRFLKEYGYDGVIYPINPKYEELQGLKCYPDVKSLPEPVDLLTSGRGVGKRIDRAGYFSDLSCSRFCCSVRARSRQAGIWARPSSSAQARSMWPRRRWHPAASHIASDRPW